MFFGKDCFFNKGFLRIYRRDFIGFFTEAGRPKATSELNIPVASITVLPCSLLNAFIGKRYKTGSKLEFLRLPQLEDQIHYYIVGYHSDHNVFGLFCHLNTCVLAFALRNFCYWKCFSQFE